MARPPKGDENRKNITLRLEPSFIDKIDDKAEQLGIRRTALIENLLSDALTSPDTEASSKEEESFDDHVDQDGELTENEQTIFDTGFEIGREEAMNEIKSIPSDKPSLDLHQCEFRPWATVCWFGSCNKSNPNFMKEANPRMRVRCSKCHEDLGELQTAIELDRCPNCGAEGNDTLEGMKED